MISFNVFKRLSVIVIATVVAVICVSASPSPARARGEHGYAGSAFGSRAAAAQAPLAVELEPNPATVPADGVQVFNATVRNASGQIIPGATVSWTANNAAGTIISSGPLTAALRVTTVAGLYPSAITASHATGNASAGANVTPGPLASITVSPSSVDMELDDLQEFTATGRDAFGNIVSGLSATWAVSPTAGSIASFGPTTMTFRSGTTPGNYIRAVRASSGAIAGTANVFLRPGPVGSVVISPTIVTLDIHAAQLFTATVLDIFGNPRSDLGVTWLTPAPVAGVIESSTANTALFRAGTAAGTFTGGMQASNPPGLGSATIVIRPGAPAQVQVSADPAALKTDGLSSSTIAVMVTDQYGNLVGNGVPVTLAVDQCAGSCSLEPLFGATNSQSRFTAVLRSTNISATNTVTSDIRVSASINGGAASDSVNVAGSFTPYRQHVPVTIRDWPNNHTSCTALSISPPATLAQPASNPFNIYRFTASASSYTVVVNDYAATGQLLLYRIIADNCATDGTISVSFIKSAPITGTPFQTTFANSFTVGQNYLLAVNTTGALTNQLYTLIVRP